MRKKQVYNPYLPLNTCIPDGEPHVFGDRVYVYGSHDEEGGNAFCVLDYEVWSAPVNNLADWLCHGISYRAKQDPTWTPEKNNAMYAPDCVQGNDGKYYLYYAMSGGHFTGPIHVAVSDAPQGPFEYYGCVRNPDGSDMNIFITFDPAVINDDGIIRLYYGWSLAVEADKLPAGGVPREQMQNVEMMLFEKTAEELAASPEGVMGANAVELENDMLTIRHRPLRIVPGQFDAKGTSFEGHAFFEASSIRKIDDYYYFIYSSEKQHELCYAISKYPNKDFVYGGVIISNGDVGYQGRLEKDRLVTSGNNHGSIENINGQWYIFYHRQTHLNSFSRQGCAEKIKILPDGSIPQVEMTSCGLNGEPLLAQGSYPAVICCNLTNGHMPHMPSEGITESIPHITHSGNERFIANVQDGTLIGYKYFEFSQDCVLAVTIRGDAKGTLIILADEEEQGTITVTPLTEWATVTHKLTARGIKALYLRYEGPGALDIGEIAFNAIG